MEFSFEFLARGHEVAAFKKVYLPSCLNITSKMPFYFANSPLFLASSTNISSETAFLSISDKTFIFWLVQFDIHDGIFDYGAGAALSFIERRDGSIHHSTSQAINGVYDVQKRTDIEINFEEYTLFRKGKYSVRWKKDNNDAVFLTSILSAFVIFSVFVLFFFEHKIGRFDLSNRAFIASIVKNSFTRQGAQGEEIDVFKIIGVTIAIKHRPDLDHLSIHDSHIPTGRRTRYQLVRVWSVKCNVF